jgi:hypothetical protein
MMDNGERQRAQGEISEYGRGILGLGEGGGDGRIGNMITCMGVGI